MNFDKTIVNIKPNKYGGSERKQTVLLNDGKKYMLKYPDPVRDKHNQLSYMNNTVSEYLGCKIYQSIGIPAQNVILGTITSRNGVTKTVCACEDLCKNGEQLIEMQNVILGEESDDNDVNPRDRKITFQQIYDLAHNIDDIPYQETIKRYSDMFVIDAFIGNTDRHNGNWGILMDDNDTIRLAPVYDCGSSLSPLIEDKDLSATTVSNQAMNVCSVITDGKGHAINYHNYLLSGNNPDVTEAIIRIVPKINLNEIDGIINESPYISEQRKQFCSDLLHTRYEKTMVPALTEALSKNKEFPDVSKENICIAELKREVFQPIWQAPLYEDSQIQARGKQIYFRRVTANAVLLQNENREPQQIISIQHKENKLLQSAAMMDIADLYAKQSNETKHREVPSHFEEITRQYYQGNNTTKDKLPSDN